MRIYKITALILASTFYANAQVKTDTIKKSTQLEEVEVFGERNKNQKD